MTPEASAAAVALRSAAGTYAAGAAAGRVHVPSPTLTRPADGAISVVRAGRKHGVRRLVSALGDIVGLVAIALAFPLAILAVGIPIALLVRLVMWIGSAL